MQSDTGNQSTQTSTNPNLPLEKQTPRDGEKPKDFVNRILAERATVTADDVIRAAAADKLATQAQAKLGFDDHKVDVIDKVVADTKAEMEKPQVATSPTGEPAPKFDFVPTKKEMGPEPAPKPEVEVAPAETELPDEPAPGSLSANYKLLKNQYKETKLSAQKAVEEKKQLTEELEKYKTGTVVPEILQEKENEIARLSTYERLFNVKGSRAYKEQVVEPLTKNNQELKQLFKDYEIPESQVEIFASLTNRADRNRFLDEHFDRRGADQAEQLLQSSAEIRKRASEIEGGSKTAIEAIEAEHKRIEEQKEVGRRQAIAENAKDSWVRALLKIRSENTIKELIPRQNDPAFNEQIVNPILTAASVEYGKFVTHLAESGVRELTPEMAEYAARMSLLAHASAVATKTRDAALQYAEEVSEGTRIGNGYFRPTVGGGVPSMASKTPPKPTLEQGVEGVLNSIIAKRR